MSSAAMSDPPDAAVTALITGQLLKHPMSSVQIKLQPGDKVYQHKKFKLSYMIGHPPESAHIDGAYTFVSKYGKPEKASSFAISSLSNYELIHTVPGKPVIAAAIAEPGTWFPINDLNDVNKALKNAKNRVYQVHSITGLSGAKSDLAIAFATLSVCNKSSVLLSSSDSYLKIVVKSYVIGLHILMQLIEVSETVQESPSEAIVNADKVAAKVKKYSGELYDFPLNFSTLISELKQKAKKISFAKSLQELGFDPQTGTAEQFQQYAQSKGYPWASVVDAELGKLLISADFHDPAYADYIDLHDAVSRFAQKVYSNRKVMAAAAKLVGLPSSDPAKGSVPQNPKAVSEYKENLKKAVMQAGGSNLLSLKPAQLNTYIKSQGGNYVGKMSAAKKQDWFKWHAAGFPTATYSLEQDAVDASSNTSVHVAVETNPGSPSSPEGKKQWQKLSEIIVGLPNGEELFKILTTPPNISSPNAISLLSASELKNLVLALNLQPFVGLAGAEIDASNIDSYSLTQVRNAVRAFHYRHWKYLPSVAAPKATGKCSLSAAQAVVQAVSKDPGGELGKVIAEAFNASGSKIPPEHYLKVLSGAGISLNARLKMVGLSFQVARLYSWSVAGFPDSVVNVSEPKDMVSFRKEVKGHILESVWNNQAFEHAPVKWIAPGTGSSFEIPVGVKVYRYQDTYAAINSSTKVGYKFGLGGSSAHLSKLHAEEIISSWDQIFEAKQPITFEMAVKEFGINSFQWNLVEEAENQDSYEGLNLPGMELVTLADTLVAFKSIKLSFPVLADEKAVLSDALKKLIHYAYIEGQWDILHLVKWKIESSYYVVSPTDQFPPGSPVALLLEKNYMSSYQFYEGIQDLDSGNGQVSIQGVAKQLGVKHSGDWSVTAQQAWQVLQAKLSGDSDTAPSSGLVLAKTSKTLPGMHSKSVWADLDGNEWMVKTFSSDPNSKARIDAEHAANMISRLHGFRAPDTRVMELEGKYSYVQLLKPAKGDLSEIKWKSLTEAQLADVMAEHVLDWLVSNHDSNYQNIMVDLEGRIFGIDKGQAFRFFPEDKFDWGYLPPTNPIPVWYDQFYAALAGGQVKQALADQVSLSVLTRAAHMQVRQDKRHRELLETAFAHRKEWSQKYPSKQQFINGLMDRKANVLATTEGLYKKLYKQGGLKWTIDSESLLSSQLSEHIHVAVSEAFVGDVLQAGSHGKALMVDSRDIEDAHILVFTEIAQDGSLVLRGELKLLADGDAVVSQWLNKQLIVDKTDGFVPSAYDDDDDHDDEEEEEENQQADPSFLYGNDSWFNALVSYTKTVNHHADDGEYNNSTVVSATSAVKQMLKQLSELDAFEKKYPGKVYSAAWTSGPEFLTLEQQAAWKLMVAKYLSEIELVSKAHQAKKKIKAMFPDLDKFEKFKYTPSASAIAELNQAQQTDSAPVAPPVPELAPTEVKKAPDGEAEAKVTSGTGKVLKVFKRKSTGTYGQFDPATGQLKHKSGELSDPYHGYEYDVESDTGAVVEYRSWNTSEVASSQKGLMRFRVSNWQGSKDAIEDVLEILQTIGVSFSQATEDSLELFYWRHLAGILRNRKESGVGKWGQTLKYAKDEFKKNPEIAPSDELVMWRQAWAKSMGKKAVEAVRYLPQFGHGIPKLALSGFTAGKPYWVRPDYTLKQLSKHYGQNLLTHNVYNFGERIQKIFQSGGIFSTEERLRLLGTWYNGMSSSSDQAKGSASFLFTRQNYHQQQAGQIFLHPAVFLRTSNYAFNEDHFGSVNDRHKYSPFDLDATAEFSNGSNELLIKNGVTVLDGFAVVYFHSASARSKSIQILQEAGVTHLHGIPIEELFVTSFGAAKVAMSKVWAAALAAEKGQS